MLSYLTHPNTSWALAMLVFISPYILRLKKKAWTPSELSELATSFGILGTFLGIVFGLIGFDVKDIQNSIPGLLNGLKTAFYTSIAGMVAGSLLKIFPGFYGVKVEEVAQDSNDVLAMILLLKEVVKNQKEISAKENDQLKNIEKALCGEGDSTVLTQIQKVRTTMMDSSSDLKKQVAGLIDVTNARSEEIHDSLTKLNSSLADNSGKLLNEVKVLGTKSDGMRESLDGVKKEIVGGSEKLVAEFRVFAEKMAESNTKALGESLAKVLDDFNTRINQHLSDNFKRLNDAVSNLLVWQEQNMAQMGQMTAQFERSLQGIKECEESLSSIRKNAESYSATAKSMEEVVYIIKTETELMHEQLRTFGSVADKAKQLFPVIEENINKLVGDFSRKITDATTEMNKLVGVQMESIQHQQQAINKTQTMFNDTAKSMLAEIDKQIKTSTKEMSDGMKGSTRDFTEYLKLSLTTMAQNLDKQTDAVKNQQKMLSDIQNAITVQMNETSSRMRSHLESMSESNAKTLAKHVEELDKQLGEELTKSLRTLGSQLTSLSYRFVEDYKPLTDKLKEVLAIAEKVKNG